MLRKRVATALVAGVLLIAAILGLSSPEFSALMALLIGVGAWEWAGLGGLDRTLERCGYALGIMSLLMLFSLFVGNVPTMGTIILVGCCFWVYALVRISRFAQHPEQGDGRAALLIYGVLALAPCWAALVLLHNRDPSGPGIVLFLLVLVSAADTGAYFAGHRFGRRKLAPNVSPGKTVEGVWGGLGAAALAALLGALVLRIQGLRLLPFLLLCLITVLASVLGDLFESMMKRQHGVKDSGHLLPGHGGLLDRIDSLTAAAPVFGLGMIWLLS